MKSARRHLEFAGCQAKSGGGGVKSENRNPKPEIRMRLGTRRTIRFGPKPFGFRPSDFLRISDFGFRISAQRSRAFTLMELLLALVVFAVVLLSMHYVFYGAIKLRNKTTQVVEASLPQQRALMMIRRDLADIVLPVGTSALSGQFVTAALSGMQTATSLAGRTVGPTFYTASGIVDDANPWSEMRKVFYQLSPPTNLSPGLDLYRNVTRNLLPVSTEQVEAQWLLGGVEEVTFEFYDGTQWRNNWDGTNETTILPAAVRVQIQFIAEPEQRTLPLPITMVVPVHVQPNTNTTTTSGGGA